MCYVINQKFFLWNKTKKLKKILLDFQIIISRKEKIAWFTKYQQLRKTDGTDIDTFTHLLGSKIWFKQVLFTEKKNIRKKQYCWFLKDSLIRLNLKNLTGMSPWGHH